MSMHKLITLSRAIFALAVIMPTGCAHFGGGAESACESCETPCADAAVCQADISNAGPVCEACEPCKTCEAPEVCETCETCGDVGYGGIRGWWNHLCCCFHGRSNAIPDVLPLGSTVRAHYQVMETNAEAADFIFHRHDFVEKSVELTPDARDKAPEVAARMRMQPFPVLIERSENNSDPGLDQQRRAFVARILASLGAPDAERRTIVSPSYGKGYNAIQAERTYYQYLNQGNNGRFGNGSGAGYGNGFGNSGFGGSGFGGGGFNGGGFAGGGVGGF